MLQLLLKPGISFMGRLAVPHKFFLIFLLYLFPVGYITYYSMTKHMTSITKAQNELKHLDLLHQFKPLFLDLAESRGLTNAFLNGNQNAQVRVRIVQEAIESQFEQISNHATYKQLSPLLKQRFSQLKSDWDFLTQKFKPDIDNSFEQHSKIIFDILNLMKGIREQSRLMTDPEPATAFLIKIFVDELPLLSEIIGQTRGVGTGIIKKGSFTSTSFIAFSNHHHSLEQARDMLNHSIMGAFNVSEQLKILSSDHQVFNQSVVNFLKTTQEKILVPDEITIAADAYFQQGTQVIDKALMLYDQTYKQLVQTLKLREKNIYHEILLNLISSIGLLLAAIYLFGSFLAGFSDSINRIKSCVNSVASGDLTVDLQVCSKDEMKKIGDDINQMINNTKSLVSQVCEATSDLVDTAKTNNESAKITNQKINQQNIEVEQVATAMNQMSATVREVANNAEQSATSTTKTDELSKQGFQVVQKTIASISQLAQELGDASSSVNELQNNVLGISSVLDVIQGIADQTNLLALNAAIEAARAGESGRGFAVVADEVRTLASKTQESTEEIRQMIDKLQKSANLSVKSMNNGTEKSQQTVKDAQKAGEALQHITDSVGHISKMGEQIAAAASEQSSVAGKINHNVMSVKSISEDTGSAATEAAKKSQFLQEIATNLKSLIAQFKI